ncbi:hypothetical protein PPROV_001081100 [Pycnococcus provasolii]|uniref:Uncharacterized protein n=1 Tax=Pycnococcus provasolii TaxID=41880 RepID=A0A830HYB4_9CHLO|nr:hypothetical protein PPROV_001081100 [Pycnococcus provasolii]
MASAASASASASHASPQGKRVVIVVLLGWMGASSLQMSRVNDVYSHQERSGRERRSRASLGVLGEGENGSSSRASLESGDGVVGDAIGDVDDVSKFIFINVPTPSILAMWIPLLAARYATHTLRRLDAQVKKLKCVNVIVHVCSGASKSIFYQMLEQLDSYPQLKMCMRATVYESGPVDFKSSRGVQFMKDATRTTKVPKLAVSAAFAALPILDTVLLPEFERQRRRFWRILVEKRLPGRTLLIASKADNISLIEDVERFAKRLSDAGAKDVHLLRLESARHMAALKTNPQEYVNAIQSLVDDVRQQSHVRSKL